MLDIADLRRRFDLREMIPAGVDFKDTPRCRAQRCLWHQEANPSLLVFPDGWFCKACGHRGDVVDWVQFEKGLTFREALEYLSRHAGTAIREIPHAKEPRPLPSGVALDYHLGITDQAISYYEHRGLSRETIVRFQLGYGSPPGHATKRFTIPIYGDKGLVNVKFRRDDTCPACGSFDSEEDHGELSCGCGETWQAQGPKYLGLKDRNTPRLYNKGVIQPQYEYGIIPSVIIAEGEFDALVTTQHGYPAVCSTGGAVNFQRQWAAFFQPVRDVYAIFDNDDAGLKGRQILREAVPRVIDVLLPMDKHKADLSDYFLRHDNTDFEAMIHAASKRERNRRQVTWLKHHN